MTAAKLALVLDEFLEAATRNKKRRSLAKLERRLGSTFARYFRSQKLMILDGTGKLRRRRQSPATESFLAGVHSQSAGPHLREAEEPGTPGLPDLEFVLEELVKAGSLDAALTDAVQGVLEQAIDEGATAAIDAAEVAIQFDLESPKVLAFLRERSGTLISGINDTSRAKLRDVLTAAYKRGDSYDELAKSIRDLFDGFSDARSRLIAVTELGNAYEEGALLASQALESAGLQMEKSWLTAGDDRVEAECEANAEAGWLPLGEEFPGGVQRPLQHPNCRCTMLSRRVPKGAQKVH